MSKEVLLMKDVPDLGSEGDVVTVADGYARNFLLPRGIGAPVTDATRRRLEKIREEREADRVAELASARTQGEALSGLSCTIPVKVSDEETMYGSVTAADLVKALADQGVQVDRHTVQLDEPIRELGVFDVTIRLHADVETSVKVWVVEE